VKEMRPTSGKVMQALFNILGPLDGRTFLDLFSGSGQISAEAKKRGAAFVCSVESDRKRHAEIVKKLPVDVKCLCIDVRRALQKFAKNGENFDVIFADPPYELGWGKEFPAVFEANEDILSAGGVVIFEHSARETLSGFAEEKWSRTERPYGGTVLTFCRRRNEE